MTNQAGTLKIKLRTVMALAPMLIVSACGSSEASTPSDDASIDVPAMATAAAEAAARADDAANAAARLPQSKAADVTEAANAVKLIINLNHRLCADIINVQPTSGGMYHVTCTKNIGGRATIDYLVDGENNTVVRI